MKAISTIFFAASALGAMAADVVGTVTCDGKPLSGVHVTDGISIVTTDARGKYKIKRDKSAETVQLIVPSGYVAPSRDGFQPSFWALLSDDAKRGERHDFELVKADQSRFTIVFTTDQHITADTAKRDQYYFETLALPRIREVAGEYADRGPVYGVNLGDISQDYFWYKNNYDLDSVICYMRRLELPFASYSVSGNHDNNPSVAGEDVDRRSAKDYRRILGPSHYSANIGNTHWVFMDDIIYKNLPGGKKAPGVAGDRSYDIGFTAAQMAWLRKDLALVPDSARVFIACHAPMVYARRNGTMFTDAAQLDTIDAMLSRFDNVTVFSGHAHKNFYSRSAQHPRLEQYVICATSGDMWLSNRRYRALGADGSDPGILSASFDGTAAPEIVYHTYDSSVSPENQMRVYDLNGVGAYYATDPVIAARLKQYPGSVNYSDSCYRDCLLINWWGDREGRTLKVVENGVELPATRTTSLDDPMRIATHFAPMSAKGDEYKKGYERPGSLHVFLVRAATSDAPVTVQVLDANGTVMQETTVERPKPFDIHMR